MPMTLLAGHLLGSDSGEETLRVPEWQVLVNPRAYGAEGTVRREKGCAR